MGYIIPFTHHTYHNYQYRMQEAKESPHYIQKTYKAVFHRITQDKEQNKQSFTQKEKKKGKEKRNQQQGSLHLSLQEHASLVGKGSYFHEKV